MRKPVLAMWCLIACVVARGSAADDGMAAAARRVSAAQARIHAGFRACAGQLRAEGLDPRFLQSIWDAERFDVFEGVRLSLARRAGRGQAYRAGTPPFKASREACGRLAEADARDQPGIAGVADSDLQAMRNAFAASHPDPHSIRDRNLHTDCMKVNFDTHDVDYASSVRLCDCTLDAMHAVPDDELDSWLELAHSGVDVPMAEQAWYGIFVDRLWACSRTL